MNKIAETISAINDQIKKHTFFDFKIYNYKNDTLILGGSHDLTYGHNLEIEFQNVFTVICNSSFTVDTKKDAITLVENAEEAKSVNQKFGVTQGNCVFKMTDERDNIDFYIMAEGISYREVTVKYYCEFCNATGRLQDGNICPQCNGIGKG